MEPKQKESEPMGSSKATATTAQKVQEGE